jgi:hypothetical protein
MTIEQALRLANKRAIAHRAKQVILFNKEKENSFDVVNFFFYEGSLKGVDCKLVNYYQPYLYILPRINSEAGEQRCEF